MGGAVEEVGIKVNLLQRREAAVGLREVRSNLGEVADAGHDVADAGADAARGLEKASSKRFARGFSAIGRGIRGVTGFLGRGFVSAARTGLGITTALTIALTGASVGAIQLASDARETGSAFDTVFGPSARGVQKDLNKLTRDFGLYNPELQDATRQFGVFGKAAGVARKQLPSFSTDLVKAGLDLSSFYNTDPGETFQALQSGLSGEAEPLRQFGIFLSDATMKTQAATMGLTGTLTEQQKVMVRQAYILGHLGDAQGDLARTSKGFANQQRAAGGRVKSFFTMLGGPLTTAGTGAFRGFNKIAKVGIRELRRNLPALEKDAQRLSKRFNRWGGQLARDLPSAIKRTSAGWDRLSNKVRGFMAQGGRKELGQLGDSVKDLGPAAAAFGRELPGISDTLSVVNTVSGFLADHTDLLAKAMPYLAAGYVGLKVSQLAANIVLAASLPLKVAELMSNRALTKSNQQLVASRGAVTAVTAGETVAIGANTGAQNVGLLARARSVVGLVAQRAAMLAGAAVTGVMKVAQWALNVALTANPIGLVIAAIALMAVGFVVLYKKSETFRGIIDVIWGGLKMLGGFIKTVVLGYLKLLATGYLTLARVGIKAFTFLLKAAFATFRGILDAADKGLGWVPGLGDKIHVAKNAFDQFGNATINKLEGVSRKLADVQDRVNDLGKDREATVRINVVQTGVLPNGTSYVEPHAEVGGGPKTHPKGKSSPRVSAPRLSAVAKPAADDRPGSKAEMLSGSASPRRSQPVQLVLTDSGGRVIAEVTRDQFRKKGNRQ